MQTQRKPETSRHTQAQKCPRCADGLNLNGFGEPQCILCGYVDYAYNPDRAIKTKGFGGTQYILRYGGDDKNNAHYKEELVHVSLAPKSRISNGRNIPRLIWRVECPMCNGNVIMEQTSLSGKRREVAEQRFKCGQGHRISVILEGDRMAWW